MGSGGVVLRIIFAVLNAYIAKRKGRSTLIWAVLGFILPFIALILNLILPAKVSDDSGHYGGYSRQNRRDETTRGYTAPGPDRSGYEQNTTRSASSDRSDLEDTLDDVMDRVSDAIRTSAKRTRRVATYCKGCGAPLVGRHDEFVTCEYCGMSQRLDEDDL